MTTAISPTRVASVFGVKTTFKNLAPGGFGLAQRIAVIAQGNTAATFAATKLQVFSAKEAGDTYGYGSPIYAIVQQLLPSSGDGVGDIPVTIYPLLDGTTASVGTITAVGTTTAAGTFFVKVNNVVTASFVVPTASSVTDTTVLLDAAINAAIEMPITSSPAVGVATVTCKWKGLTGDDLVVSVEGPSVGVTFTVLQPTAGATDPVITAAVTDQFGDVWETMVIQSLGGTTLALDAMAAFNEGRWDPEVSKPLHGSYYASVETVVATAITVPNARTTDRTNVQLSAPGCNDYPWAIAARMCARIAKVANSASAASDYTRQQATGLTPGLDSEQWSSAQRDTVVKGGVSTSVVRGGVINLEDTITMYHPVGDPTPGYRYVNDIVKLQNILNDIRLKFDSAEWAGAPLIPDDQATSNRSAKQPKMAKAELFKLIDSWALDALISNPAAAKDSVLAAIDGGNQRRLNLALTVQLSGNAGIISTDLNFGFFFGAA